MEQIMLFKNLIREIRLKGKYTQPELAHLLNTDQTTISKWELGKMKPRILSIQRVIEFAKNNTKIDVKFSDIEN